MKKIFFILIIAALFSCKKDDNTTEDGQYDDGKCHTCTTTQKYYDNGVLINQIQTVETICLSESDLQTFLTSNNHSSSLVTQTCDCVDIK
jgi:hypothetical protein